MPNQEQGHVVGGIGELGFDALDKGFDFINGEDGCEAGDEARVGDGELAASLCGWDMVGWHGIIISNQKR